MTSPAPQRAMRCWKLSEATPARERGQVLLLLLVVFIAASAHALVRSLNAASLASKRLQITGEALAQAKEALIARAVNDTDPSGDPSRIRPGSLPCPDLNDDGRAELFSGNQCPAYLGRLPWYTLNLPDLRDGHGERLWYALSPAFRDHPSAILNSADTRGELAVVGRTPATDVAAIVFSPGPPLIRENASTRQDRSGGTGPCPGPAPYAATPKCNPVNYLDATQGEDNADGNRTFVTAMPGAAFNDQLLPITADDIMALVEIRAARETAARLREHFNAWATSSALTTPRGWYPWAAPFVDPSAKSAGVDGTLHGLVPLEPTNVSPWKPRLEVNGMPAGSCTRAPLRFSCSAGINAGDVVTFTADLDHVGTAFILPPPTTTVSISPVGAIATAGPSWSLSGVSGGRLSCTVGGTATITGTLTIRGEAKLSAWTQDSWLLRNQWHKVLYYAVSSGFTITGPGGCGGALPACVTVENTPEPADKHAVVLATGRALAGQTRPPENPTPSEADYLEGQNRSPDLRFEFNRRSASFNDYVVVVSP